MRLLSLKGSSLAEYQEEGLQMRYIMLYALLSFVIGQWLSGHSRTK